MADVLDRLQALGLGVTRIRLAGGGARSEIWTRIRADATGLPVRLEVLTGSKADRFYLRHGFIKLREDEIEGYYERPAPAARA